MKILNKEQLDSWMNERRRMGRDLVAVKGIVPGATYSDGTPVERPMNIAWRDCASGEVMHIEYDIEAH